MVNEEKVKKIEEFVNEKLKRDLKITLEAGDAVYAEVSEYLELQDLLNKFREMNITDSELETMVDAGCNFYVKAKIPSIQRLYVDIGLGFYLEMEHNEALSYIRERTRLLNDRAELFRRKSFEIKARIKLCLEGLRELQSLNISERPEYHDVL